jgi:hypothetical protein
MQTWTSSPASPPVAVAPAVLALQRFGFGDQPTTLMVSFSAAIDPARAQDLRNYRLVGRGPGRLGRPIGLLSAAYDPSTESVTLEPARRLPLHRSFVLSIDGAAYGGSDFVTRFGKNALAGSSDLAFNRARYRWAGRGPFGGLQFSTRLQAFRTAFAST